VFFLDPDRKTAGEWLFLIGSILFAFVPMVTVLQGIHLDRISKVTSRGRAGDREQGTRLSHRQTSAEAPRND
jgi:hypothetical protein